MARLTPEQRAAMEKQLADDAAEPDDDDEIELGLPGGGYVRGTFRRVSQVAEAHGFKLKADPPADDDAGKGAAKGNVRPAHFGGQQRKSS